MKAEDNKMKKSRTKSKRKKKGATDTVEQEGVLVRSKKVAPLELVEVGTAEVDITKPDIVATGSVMVVKSLGELGDFPVLVCVGAYVRPRTRTLGTVNVIVFRAVRL